MCGRSLSTRPRPGAVSIEAEPAGRPSPRVRVVVADDHPLYREGVLRAIKARPELEAVGVAADGREALAEIERLRPDVAVLDVRMPGSTGSTAAGCASSSAWRNGGVCERGGRWRSGSSSIAARDRRATADARYFSG